MQLALIPQPESIEYSMGTFLLRRDSVIGVETECVEMSQKCVGLLQQEIEDAVGIILPVQSLGTREAGVEESGNGVAISAAKYKSVVRYQLQPLLCGEQYEIRMTTNEVVLLAGEGAGFWYATQTLRQIIRQCGAVLPLVQIKDEPKFAVRGFYHDVTRGRVPTLEYLKSLADTCAFYKMNQLQLYVEHCYLFQELQGLFADRDPLTAEEIREFDAYCRERYIELVPSLSVFGHLYELLQTEEYAHLCELPVDTKAPFSFYDRMAHHTLNVSDPESEALVRRLIHEYAALFSSDKFNICSDETFDLGKGKNKELAGREGITGLYMGFLKKLCNMVTEIGKTPMFWGDILQEFPEQSRELPKDTICLYWNYEPQAHDDKLRGLVDAGIKNLYVCPGVHGWNHLINRYDHAYANISKLCEFAGNYGVEGILVTDWGDYGHINHPDFSVPGLIYGAAFAWGAQIMEKEEIDKKISLIEYRDPSGRFMECVNRLSEGEDITWGQAVCMKEERPWDQFVPEHDPERKQRLLAAVDEGYDLLVQVPNQTKERLGAYLLAAEGQLLLQEAYARVNDRQSARELSSKIRLWYRDYQKLWRSVSKESELHRIGEVVFWYANRV